MARIVVFGYGNPLRGDDGVGWRVAEAIGERWPGQVLVRAGQQPVPEWAADLRDAHVAYFVDASLIARAPEVLPISSDMEALAIDSHALRPAQLVCLARAVYGRAPRSFALHVPAIKFDFGDTLSCVASGGVRLAVNLLDARIAAEVNT